MWIDGELFSNGKCVWKPSEAVRLPAVSDSKAARATLDKLLAECRTPTYDELEDLRAL